MNLSSGLNHHYYAHPSAYVDEPCEIGNGVKIWHFSHVMPHVRIGDYTSIGQNVVVLPHTIIGKHCKIQSNIVIPGEAVLEDYIFVGPGFAFTNVVNPRAEISRRNEFKPTLVRRGASLGANAVVICGTTVGRYAFIGAGAVVRGNVPDYALMLGVPARRKGWMSRHGHQLRERDRDGYFICPQSEWRYQEIAPDQLVCLDWPEDKPLPAEPATPMANS